MLHLSELSGLSHYPEICQLSRDRLEHEEHRRQSLTGIKWSFSCLESSCREKKENGKVCDSIRNMSRMHQPLPRKVEKRRVEKENDNKLRDLFIFRSSLHDNFIAKTRK